MHGVEGYEEGLKNECPYCGKIILHIDQHIRKLHREKSGYSFCEVCRKKVEGDMNKHRAKCIFCPFCSYENNRKTRLLKHIATHHTKRRINNQTEVLDLSPGIGLYSILKDKTYWKMN